MRHAIFDNETDALRFAERVQQEVDARPEEAREVLCCGQAAIRIIPSFIGWMGKWAISMPVEPADLTGIEVVDSIDPPVVEMEGL